MTVASAPIRPFAASVPLVFRRLRTNDSARVAPSLGGRRVGRSTRALHATVLAPELDTVDILDEWLVAAAATEDRHGCVRYVTDGHWLHGIAEIDDQALGLQEASRLAYSDVFQVLADSECPHLLRLWNYFERINQPAGGVERYRLFNAGRQQAFLDSKRSAFEGAPAACALGLEAGPLQVHFLAGLKPPIAIENPRQISAYQYPELYGARPPTFSRAALADVGSGCSALFISGTASIVGHVTLHVGDVRRQTEEAMRNIVAILDSTAAISGTRFAADALTYTVYVRHAIDLNEVRGVFEQTVGATSGAAMQAIYLRADICRADLLVEIEAHGLTTTGSVT